ncbi:MAG: DNA-3-methyladenine glycosylase I [Actinomycetota bacterium]
MSERLREGPDGRVRCWWPGDAPDYMDYHDNEWGRPVTDDRRLFEKICLEGFQSGLSWITILRKRENFRAAFADFDFATVAEFDEGDVERLLGDAGIIRHRGKIEATINNAARALELVERYGSVAAYVWEWRPTSREPDLATGSAEMVASTATSKALSTDLKKRGWRFFGPTTAYAFMQAMGLVNDHMPDCEWYEICEAEQAAVTVPQRSG